MEINCTEPSLAKIVKKRSVKKEKPLILQGQMLMSNLKIVSRELNLQHVDGVIKTQCGERAIGLFNEADMLACSSTLIYSPLLMGLCTQMVGWNPWQLKQ